MKFFLVATVMMCGLSTPSAYAQTYEGGDWAVSNVRIDQQTVYVTLSPPPVGCGGGTNYGAHIAFQNFQQLYATALTAYTSGIRLSGIRYSNTGPCSSAAALNTYMNRLKDK